MYKPNWTYIVDIFMICLFIMMIIIKMMCIYNMICKKLENDSNFLHIG